MKPSDPIPTTKAKRGRKIGYKSDKPTQSELYAGMGSLEIGDYFYLEGTFDEALGYQRRVSVGDHRKPIEAQGKKFTTAIYTAVCARLATDVRYVIRIERTE